MKSKINCFFGKHNWSGTDNNICSVCGKIAIGLQKFIDPTTSIQYKQNKDDLFCLYGCCQIPPVKDQLPPPIFVEEVAID